MMKQEVLFCTLLVFTFVFVHGDQNKNRNRFFNRITRKRQFGRPVSQRIGVRLQPSFETRRSEIIEQNILDLQTKNLKESVKKPQNRDLRDGFDELAFWENYLMSEQVGSLPPPVAPSSAPVTVSPVPPPTFNPTNAPQTVPTEAPTCKPICT